MRVQAKNDLTYNAVLVVAGGIFDVPDDDGRALINRDLVVPYNLEDPNQRSPSYDVLEAQASQQGGQRGGTESKQAK